MKKLIAVLICCFFLKAIHANDVVISNVSIVNGGTNNIYLQFDLSWENSWRVNTGPANYDGVWVFFKYKTSGDIWRHLYLDTSTVVDVLPVGISYWRPTTFPTGAIIHRSSSNTGMGNINVSGIRLALRNDVAYDIEVRAFAVEMVYIPPANSIYLGDGDGIVESTNAFHREFEDNRYAPTNQTTFVDANGFDDAEIEPFGYGLSVHAFGGDGIVTSVLNSYFPTCSATWCMKYEITQGGYRDFLNTLSLTQQTTRTATAPNSPVGTGALVNPGADRNFIEIKTPSTGTDPALYGCDASANDVFDEAADGEFVACNYLGFPDLAAWLAWAGMCPMTEIQFERICRGTTSAGPVIPQFGEFAWGTTSLFFPPYTLTSEFTASELASNASATQGNASFSFKTNGPLRNGIFATATTNRVTSGAAFYGVMEMSGGVWESCVTIGNVCGRSFNKLGTSRSDGFLTGNGNAYATYWPGTVADPNTQSLQTGEVLYGTGTKLRGGSWNLSANNMTVSDRSGTFVSVTRWNHQGGRGVIVPAMY